MAQVSFAASLFFSEENYMVSDQDLWISKSLLILIGSFIIFSVVGTI